MTVHSEPAGSAVGGSEGPHPNPPGTGEQTFAVDQINEATGLLRERLEAGAEASDVWAEAVELLGRDLARQVWWVVLGGFDGQAQT